MGKELVFKALNHEKVDQIPWVPFTGIHAGSLKGYDAEEMLKDTDKIVECITEVDRLYMPDGVPNVFDLQIEAEILGCDLVWAKDNPPSVASHPYMNVMNPEIPCDCKIPGPDDGRIPVVMEATKKIIDAIGDHTAVYGLFCGPVTLASHLRGSDIFIDMIADPEYAKGLVDFCAKVGMKMADMYIDAGCDVVAAVDPLISQIAPNTIEEMFNPAFKAIFDYVRSKGKKSCFFVCGNATTQIPVMCKTGPDCISVDENVNLAEAKKITDEYNICIAGNIPLTTTMLHGTQQDNIKAVIDELDAVAETSDIYTNLIVSPGCDMPYAVPSENAIACGQATKNIESSRAMVENYTSSFEDIDVELPDYSSYDKVALELWLLDPEQCAACTYMKAAVMDNLEDVEKKAEVIGEYRYTIKEDIARFMKAGVAHLPAISLDGEIVFNSIIPSRDELLAKIDEYAAKKAK